MCGCSAARQLLKPRAGGPAHRELLRERLGMLAAHLPAGQGLQVIVEAEPLDPQQALATDWEHVHAAASCRRRRRRARARGRDAPPRVRARADRPPQRPRRRCRRPAVDDRGALDPDRPRHARPRPRRARDRAPRARARRRRQRPPDRPRHRRSDRGRLPAPAAGRPAGARRPGARHQPQRRAPAPPRTCRRCSRPRTARARSSIARRC